jgi:deoxyribodipyrimidine photo-lyase
MYMPDRILTLKTQSVSSPQSVVYIMSRDQRTRDNHALLLAQQEAVDKNLPLVVAFILLDSTGHRSREHYEFMIDGLREVASDLDVNNITFVLRAGNPKQEIAKLMEELHPASLYLDFSPLRGPRAIQKHIAKYTDCSVYVVDTHNIIPTWVLSDKEEFAAHTIRRKIHKALGTWCIEPGSLQKHPHKLSKDISSVSWDEAHEFIQSIPASGIKLSFKSGESAAKEQLNAFLSDGLEDYAAGRNDATADAQSDLSPYLHFGQISSLRITLECLKVSDEPPFIFRYPKLASFEGTPTKQDGIDVFLEELIVRKELSDNFCFYQPRYDSLYGAKQWAKDSLAMHADDPREFIYTKEQFEAAQTHDKLWNAAQNQLLRSGKIHGYLRMYWAKKILEWSKSPKEAVQIAIYLNDHYSIDGGDPNGYVGILWSIAGVHDRAWFERSVYGKIRYMAESGAKKRFSIEEYISTWS